jgi:hypothetical protein
MKKITLLHPIQPDSGMFAFIWQTIRGIYHFPNDMFYILFGKESCYYDTDYNYLNNKINVWDYYFEQPHLALMPPIENIDKEVGLLFDEFSEFRDIYLTKETYDQRRIEYNNIINKYIKLLPHVKDKINNFYVKNFKDKKVLGIHCRGTDHPDKLGIIDVVEMSKDYVNKYDVIFVTSDQQEYISEFKKIYGNKIIEYNVITRSNGSIPLHIGNSMNQSKYRIGEDTIIEAYLHSKTDFLLCTVNSNVNYFIRALNKDLPFKILKNYDTN